jgi:hypothetical protein
MNLGGLTLLNRFASALFIGFNFVPKHHSQLSILDGAGDEDFTLLFELFDRLWCFLPGLFQRADRYAATFPSLALYFCQKRGFVAKVEVVLQTAQPSCAAVTCRTYTVGVKIRFGVVLDAVMRLEFLQENYIGIQRCVRHDRNVLQPHRVWGGLNMKLASPSRRWTLKLP